MASQVICECGYVMRDDDEDRVVALVRDHIRTDHPALLDMATPETIRTWIQITPQQLSSAPPARAALHGGWRQPPWGRLVSVMPECAQVQVLIFLVTRHAADLGSRPGFSPVCPRISSSICHFPQRQGAAGGYLPAAGHPGCGPSAAQVVEHDPPCLPGDAPTAGRFTRRVTEWGRRVTGPDVWRCANRERPPIPRWAFSP